MKRILSLAGLLLTLVLGGALLSTPTAHAQALRFENYIDAGIQAEYTAYRSLPDGGATIASCGFAISVNTSPDGGRYTRDRCTDRYVGRTAAQRNALANCLDNGERVIALELGTRADAGF